MNFLSVSILAADFSKLGEQVLSAVLAGAQYVHIDVMDGIFVPNISLGFPVFKSIRPCTDAVFDVHLMIQEPGRYIEACAKSGADIVTVHIESTNNISQVLNQIHSMGKRAGITLKPGTDVNCLIPYLSKVDMVLVMTVEPGFGGQAFIPSMLEKVRLLKEYKTKNNLNYDIEVDGGINLDNLEQNLNAGANVIVAGSSIFTGNINNNVKNFIDKMA